MSNRGATKIDKHVHTHSLSLSHTHTHTHTHAHDRVARSKKIKKAKFGHKQFQKGQILKNEKRPNKGQISLKKIVKITKIKFRIS